MGKPQRGLSAREKSFCSFFVSGGGIRESALMAGYAHPEKDGAALMAREDICREIGRMCQAVSRNARHRAGAGYERLAFGRVSDAVSLIFSENPTPEELEGLDLFNVAEIRRPKDGAMEIKFFDRMKALEKLEEMGEEKRTGVSDFYAALVAGNAHAAGDTSVSESEEGD